MTSSFILPDVSITNSTFGRTKAPFANAALVNTSESSATAGGALSMTAMLAASVQRILELKDFMVLTSDYLPLAVAEMLTRLRTGELCFCTTTVGADGCAAMYLVMSASDTASVPMR